MRKNHVNLLIWISILIYILACLMPAYVEAVNSSSFLRYNESSWTEYRDCPGFVCLFSGIFLPLGLLFGYWGTAVWLANVYYFSALFLLFCHFKKQWPIISFAIVSIIIGSTLMFYTLQFADRDYFCWIESLLSGYYLWLLSFVTLFVGLLVEYLPPTAKRGLTLIYGISMIPVCTCIITSSLDKGDNSIIFDEKTQCLVANKSLDALIIDDGTNETLLKRGVGSDSVIALKDIFSSFRLVEKNSSPITFTENNIYEIYNATYVRAPKQKIRIEISRDGWAQLAEIPKEEGDNSFYFDIATQCLVTNSYFGTLVIESEKQLFWLESRGLKRNKVPINNLGLYFEENDTFLPLKTGHYIINNCTHSEKNVHRMTIHLNEDGVIDSLLYLPPKKYV